MTWRKRTDLAVEARQLWCERTGRAGALAGVKERKEQREGYEVTEVEVVDQRGAQALGKPVGRYVTVELGGLHRREGDAFGRGARVLAQVLSGLLPPGKGTVLVVGLGNRAITPDVIGPAAVESVLVTRHLVEQEPRYFGSFRPVAALSPGVLGTTGMESGALVKAVAEDLKPQCIVAVDALAARSIHRLCTTVQLSDTGIVPGSGVGNARAALDAQTLGVPVIAVGVPTVVDGATLAADLLEQAGQETDPRLLRQLDGGGMVVTTRDIDQQAADLAKVIGYGITLALQPQLSMEDLQMLLN